MLLAQILVCIGVLITSISIFYTFSFAWDPRYEAPALPSGPRHTNYHAFREGMLAVAAIVVMLFVIFSPEEARSVRLWLAMLIVATGLYSGWWLPRPILGLKAPGLRAELVHLGAAGFSLAGIFLARAYFY